MKLDFLLKKYKALFYKCGYNKPTMISAMPQTAKTVAALNFCEEKSNCLYFSFENYEVDFALKTFCGNNPETIGRCSNWKDFFTRLGLIAKEKRLTVFFDNAGVRNDKTEFYDALRLFLKMNTKTSIIFLCRPWEKINIDCNEVNVDAISLKEISAHFDITDKEAANIYLLTGGVASILSEFDIKLSFEDNIKKLLNTKSAFCRYALKWMSECFRSPENYNTLLYAVANGYNRISEISSFSGQAKNKCDKYLKSLIQYGFVRTEIGKNGYTKYYPANSYLCLWYKLLFTATPNADDSFGIDIYEKFIKYFRETILFDFYKGLCINWAKENNVFLRFMKNERDFVNKCDITIDDITFGIVYTEGGRNYYFYFDTFFGEGVNKSLVEKVERITTKDCPFYDNEYYFLSLNRIPDSMEKLSHKYDNIHFIRLSVLFTAYKNRKK